ncbi:THAP domain-containing protein 9, partial [Stegodyphus mimosarum]
MKVMGRYCCVPFCESNDYKKGHDKGLSFHEFPCDLGLRMVWLENIRRQDPDTGLPWVPKELSVVCGLHFSEDQYKKGISRKILKPKAIPTIFPNYPSYIQKAILKKSKEYISNYCLKPRTVSSVKYPRLHKRNKNRPFIVKCNLNSSKSTFAQKTEFESRSVEVNELDDIIGGASDVNEIDTFLRNNDNDQNVQSDETISNFEFGTKSIDECEHITQRMSAKENYDELRLAKEHIQILEEKIKFLETENKKLLKDNECLTKMLCARI